MKSLVVEKIFPRGEMYRTVLTGAHGDTSQTALQSRKTKYQRQASEPFGIPVGKVELEQLARSFASQHSGIFNNVVAEQFRFPVRSLALPFLGEVVSIKTGDEIRRDVVELPRSA